MNSTRDIAHWPLLRSLDREFLITVKRFFLYHIEESVLLFTNDDRVYAYGCNMAGLLGIGSTIKAIEEPREVVELSGRRISSVVTGRTHVMALCEDHSLYGWGENYCGQVGVGSADIVFSPQLVLQNVKSVSCGALHTVAIGINGEVWAWGHNLFGQVGESRGPWLQQSVRYPNVMFVMQRLQVIEASCGSCYTAYSTGNKHYTFGLFEYNKKPIMKSLPEGTQVVSFSAYFSFVLLITEQGELYRLFTGRHGKGYELLKTAEPIDTLVTGLDYHIAILVGRSGTFYVMDAPPYKTHRIFRVSLTSITDIWYLYGNFTHSMPNLTDLPLDVVADDKIEALNLFNDKSSSDFVLRILGKPIYLHKNMLKTVPFFQHIFQQNPTISNYSLNDTKFNFVIYYHFLCYCYCNRVQIESSWFFEFLTFICDSNNEDLLAQCFNIVSNYTAEDVSSVIADHVQNPHLERHICEDPQTPESIVKYFEAAALSNDSCLQNKIARAVLKQTEWSVEQCTTIMQPNLAADFTNRIVKINQIIQQVSDAGK